MPRIKPSASEMAAREFRAAYRRGLELKGIKPAAVAKLIGKSERTLRNYIKNPEGMPLRSLQIIVKSLAMTDDEILRIIKGR